MATSAAAPNVEVYVGGEKVADSNFLAYTVDRDMFQPDMASIVLSNQGDIYTVKSKVGDAIEIKVGDSSTSIYKGEIVGIEPVYKGGEKTRVLIRAMNKLHRMLRKRKSITFTDKTDQQILNQVVGDSGLSLEWKHETSITYKHVYQHNQTDLEFLRTRAARMGCHVWCVDTTVYVKQPDLQSGPIAELKVDESSQTGTLRHFAPRLSSHAIVKKVTVKGWNPETKQLITGEASAQNSPLGSQNAVAGAGDLASDETFTVDQPIWSKEEADALAKARMQDLSLSYVTGEAECSGDPVFDLGKVVSISANSDPDASPSDDPFNGKYYIMGVTHKHQSSKSKDGGFTSILRLARDAQKQ
ncbi:MAG TPA: contractile injection system protein, VgrG/Pvc8 family [Kofleriaceae bacterium]|nr:contractile injection system protein, VgrG/Pvc8 family [Kofleriaceae bacterium]